MKLVDTGAVVNGVRMKCFNVSLPTLSGYSQEIFIGMNVEDYGIAAQGILHNWELMPSCIGCY